MYLRSFIKFALVAVLCMGEVVLADWDVGDPALYYQLPDSAGWSVYSEWQYGAADDWTADIDAPITDIYFWGGWKNDMIGDMGGLLIKISDNDTSAGFARPGNQLWEGVFSNYDSNPDNDYTSRLLYPEGDQGWYDPRYTDQYHWQANNHNNMYQYNIPTITNPFIQQAGNTYWLMISTISEGGEWGWKTSLYVSGNTSVFWDKNETLGWTELMTPLGYQDPRTPLDLAFVIATPEPTTSLLLTLGGLLLRKRKA